MPNPLPIAATVLMALAAPAPPAGEATEATRAANAAVAARLPLEDPQDFADAARGKLAEIPGGVIRDAEGNIVWDAGRFAFLDGAAPATANPSLWRQSRLNAVHGLFEVVPGIYQVRGYDLAVMTLVRGQTGWIVIDPLLSAETAAAGLALANATLGERPVSAIVFTHSHADHFGGAGGLLPPEEIAGRGIPVLAPEGFTREAISENLLAHNLMARRAGLMFGTALPPGPAARIGIGLGQGLSAGRATFVRPTREIGATAPDMTIDGIVFDFIDAAGTEAPAEFMFHLPQFRALMTAEVATATLHNALTLRGAKVRDTLAWSRAIDGALRDYGGRADVVFASHHWPTWGAERVRGFLENQRDIYRYLHDQTMRRANAGMNMAEIAEDLPEPALSERDFSTRGYYGTLRHNAKAVYQHYFGWWDGVPARFDPLPPEEEARRTVAAMGGPERALALGREAFARGEYRWAARLFDHLVFAGAGGEEAKEWLAATYEQLGFQAESGAWRTYYLSAARELREGPPPAPPATGAAFLAAIPTADLFDALAVRYVPGRIGRAPFALQFVFPDRGERLALLVRDAALIPRPGGQADDPAATITLRRSDFDALLAGEANPVQLALSGRMRIEGDATAVRAMFGALEAPPEAPAIVTP